MKVKKVIIKMTSGDSWLSDELYEDLKTNVKYNLASNNLMRLVIDNSEVYIRTNNIESLREVEVNV